MGLILLTRHRQRRKAVIRAVDIKREMPVAWIDARRDEQRNHARVPTSARGKHAAAIAPQQARMPAPDDALERADEAAQEALVPLLPRPRRVRLALEVDLQRAQLRQLPQEVARVLQRRQVLVAYLDR